MKLCSLIAAIGLVLSTNAWAAPELTLIGVGGAGCAQASTFVARISGENNSALTTMICGLVNDGLIDSTASMASTGSNPYCGSGSVFDVIQMHAMANSTDALLDICGHTSAVAHGSPTFTANCCFTGVDNSTTVYIDTGYAEGTGGNVASQNNAHYSYWSLTASATSVGFLGVDDGTQRARFYPADPSGNTYASVNDNNNINAGFTTTGSNGWLLAQRTGASARAFYRNGSSVSSDTGASVGVPAGNFYDLNANASVLAGVGFKLALFTAGKSLSGTQLTKGYSRFCTYITAVNGSC